MTRLTKGMYGDGLHAHSDLFGLSTTQVRQPNVIKNAGWYNAAGELLGFGDLSVDDFRHITHGLEDGELFIVLFEDDATWNVFNRSAADRGRPPAAPDLRAPGLDYVTDRAAYVITATGVFIGVSLMSGYVDGDAVPHWCLGPLTAMSHERLAELARRSLTVSS